MPTIPNKIFCIRERANYVLMLFCVLLVLTQVALGQEKKNSTKTAPPNHVVLSHTIDGWQLVPKEFKQTYDTALAQLEALQADVASGKIRASKAQAELAELKKKLADLRKEIDERKVHVAGATLYEQSETIEFELGKERRLAITCNQVHVIGWEGPKVKCVLKKRVLSPDGEPVEEHLKELKTQHVLERAAFAGKTPLEMEQEEREYLAKEGAKLTEAQRAFRRSLLDEISRSRAIYHEFVGRDIDQVTVDGLGYEQNKSISMRIESEGAGGEYGSVRQRYGELTVYVPSCAGVVVRGAARGLIVENLAAPLVVVGEDSTDSDHRGKFEVRGLKGDLNARSFPLRVVTNVDGHVAIHSTEEFGVEAGGTSHYDNLRDLHPPRPLSIEMHHVTGGVDLLYGRVNLDLADIQGKVNVSNEFGDTRFTAAAKFAPHEHRLFTQSGRIDVQLTADAWSSTPVLGVTNYGRVRTNVSREEFEDFHLVGTDKRDGSRRDWVGFRTVSKPANPDERFTSLFGQMERFQQVIDNAGRSAGLDLLSRNGHITITRE